MVMARHALTPHQGSEVNIEPITPHPAHAAYIALIVSLCNLGLTIGALGAAIAALAR